MALSTVCAVECIYCCQGTTASRPQAEGKYIYTLHVFILYFLLMGRGCVCLCGDLRATERNSNFSPSTCGFPWTALRSSSLVASTFAPLLSQLAGPNSYFLYSRTMNLRRHQAPLGLFASGVTVAEPRGIKVVQETGHALEDNTDKGGFVDRASAFLSSSPEDSRHSGQEWESRVEYGPSL